MGAAMNTRDACCRKWNRRGGESERDTWWRNKSGLVAMSMCRACGLQVKNHVTPCFRMASISIWNVIPRRISSHMNHSYIYGYVCKHASWQPRWRRGGTAIWFFGLVDCGNFDSHPWVLNSFRIIKLQFLKSAKSFRMYWISFFLWLCLCFDCSFKCHSQINAIVRFGQLTFNLTNRLILAREWTCLRRHEVAEW